MTTRHFIAIPAILAAIGPENVNLPYVYMFEYFLRHGAYKKQFDYHDTEMLNV